MAGKRQPEQKERRREAQNPRNSADPSPALPLRSPSSRAHSTGRFSAKATFSGSARHSATHGRCSRIGAPLYAADRMVPDSFGGRAKRMRPNSLRRKLVSHGE